MVRVGRGFAGVGRRWWDRASCPWSPWCDSPGTSGAPGQLKLAVSGRNLPELPYADELAAAGATIALTRVPHGERPAGRLTAADLMPLLVPGATAYVCGSAGFAEFASLLLVGLGVPVLDVRVERFGPSG